MFNKNITRFFAIFVLLFFALINSHSTQALIAIITQQITQDTVWTKENNPYIIDIGGLIILPNATLTIEPGVIIQFSGFNLFVNGNLIVNGTEEEPVVFTSRCENSTLCSPHPGDWGAIQVEGNGKLIMNYTVVKYGGNDEGDNQGGAIAITDNAQVNINNSILTNNKTAIKTFNNITTSTFQVTIHNSQIFNNQFFGIINLTGPQIDATNNWWGDDSGPYHEQFNPDGKGEEVVGKVSFYPWIIKNSNQVPIIQSLNQYKSDGITILEKYGITTGDSVIFAATSTDPDGDKIKIQVEVSVYNDIFQTDYLTESNFVESGQVATATINNLANGKYSWRVRAIDEKGASSPWYYYNKDNPFETDYAFEIKIVPLYTQIESQYPSNDETKIWANLEYAAGYSEDYYCGKYIKDCGCGITSLVMLLRYHNIIIDVNNNDVNPATINNWLKNSENPIGYYDGDINWKAIEGYARDPLTKKLRIVFMGRYDGTPNNTEIKNLLDEDLAHLEPVILRHDNIGHFTLATEKLATTYRIRDPWWYNTKTLNQTISPEDKSKPYNNYKRNYNNHYDGLRRFAALGSYDTRPVYYAGIDFTIASPAELLIIDSMGRKLGKDPINNIEYNEIPGGTYTREGIGNPNSSNNNYHYLKSIWIPDPLDINYRLQVIGTGEGQYKLFSNISDKEGNSTSTMFISNIAANKIQEYILYYDSDDINNLNLAPRDTTPPEIQINFSPNKNDILITGIDDITPSSIVTETVECFQRIGHKCLLKQYIYTIKDNADNFTKLWLLKFKHKNKIIIKLLKIQYNEKEIIKIPTQLIYIWHKKNTSIKFLLQKIKYSDFWINARYNNKQNITIINGKNYQTGESINEKQNGLTIINLITNKGVLNYDF